MKTIQKRFYSLTHRSLYTSQQLAFFDSPTPPPPRPPHVISTSRLPNKPDGDGQHNHSHQPPFSLALTSPQQTSNNSPPLAPAGSYAPGYLYSLAPLIPFYTAHKDAPAPRKKTRFQLDVGAYGIAKRSRPTHTQYESSDDLGLAVQIGEDAYFVRDNAMGVADGVGGWAKASRTKSISPDAVPSPSALFARRLMNFCSAETELATPWWDEYEDPETEAVDPLEELQEGLDVLMILEKAYDSAIKAHVIPTPEDTAASSIPTPPPSPKRQEPKQQQQQGKTALLSGSSTALLAVLDHTHHTPPPTSLLNPTPRSPPRPRSTSTTTDKREGSGAVLKIAHLGDCMGMLVRGEEIIWRSEEMWWSFNTPVQLGPLSPTRPSTHAHTHTLPIEADDILILASDGLSDNLWDEEVVDEVVRMRRSFLPGGGVLGRKTLAGMLSEALCSRARRVSERRGEEEGEVPFARRAREMGRVFRGGKVDDISVVVAVISPADTKP